MASLEPGLTDRGLPAPNLESCFRSMWKGNEINNYGQRLTTGFLKHYSVKKYTVTRWRVLPPLSTDENAEAQSGAGA